MKKVTLAVLAMTLILTACSGDDQAQVDTQVDNNQQEMAEQPVVPEEDSSEMMEEDSNMDTQEEMSEEETMESQDDQMMSEEEDSSEMVEEDSNMDTQEEMSEEETMESQDDQMMSEEENTSEVSVETEVEQEVKVGNEYVVYSQEVMADTQNPKILFFHATWCPTCKAADSAFSGVENTIGLDIVKVDYDEYSDLKSQYGVVSQHTFVLVDGNGNMLKRWYGSKNYDEVLEELQS